MPLCVRHFYILETLIRFNISMLFYTSWCDFIIKFHIVLVQVLTINNALITLLLKCRSPSICECLSHCLLICIATLPVLSSENRIFPNLVNLWIIQTADFKKLLYQIKIKICLRLLINAVIIPFAVFAIFPSN